MMPDEATVMAAAHQLGWAGDLVGPVRFGGLRFWVIARDEPAHADGTHANGSSELASLTITGCLFTGADGQALIREASLLAAYAPRAVLVSDTEDLTPLLVDAAVLDQGVVVLGEDSITLLAGAGPRVASGPYGARGRALLQVVHAARSQDRLRPAV